MLVNAVLSLVFLFCGFHAHTSAVEDRSWSTVRAVLLSPFLSRNVPYMCTCVQVYIFFP